LFNYFRSLPEKGLLKKGFFFLCLFSALSVYPQNFELDQIEQIWRPRLKLDAKYLGPSAFSDTTGNYSSSESNFVLTFPIKSKVDAELKLDLSSLKLKDIFKNSVRIKAYEVLGNVRFGVRQANLGFDSISQNRNVYYGQAGILGLKLTRKYRILFYSLNAYVSEDQKSLNSAAVRFNGILGQFHLRGLRKNFFYGIYAGYSDGLFIPVPFIGGKVPFGKKWSFNYLIPAQINVMYSPTKNISLSSGVTVDGYRGGVNLYSQRVNLNYGNLSGYLSYRHKLSRIFNLRLEGGYVIKQYITISDIDAYRSSFPIGQGFYGQISITTLFGKSLFEKAIDGIKPEIF